MSWPGMGMGNQFIALGNAICVAASTNRNLLIGSFSLHWIPDKTTTTTNTERPFFSLIDREHFHKLLRTAGPLFKTIEIYDALSFDPLHHNIVDALDVTNIIVGGNSPFVALSKLPHQILFTKINMFLGGVDQFCWDPTMAIKLRSIFAKIRLVPPLSLFLPPPPEARRRHDLLAVHFRMEDDWIHHMLLMSCHYPGKQTNDLDGVHGFGSLSLLLFANYVWKIQEVVKEHPNLRHLYLMTGLLTQTPHKRLGWILPRLYQELLIRCPHIQVTYLSKECQINSILGVLDLDCKEKYYRDLHALLDYIYAISQPGAILTTYSPSSPLQSTFSSFIHESTPPETHRMNLARLILPFVEITSARYASVHYHQLAVDVLDKILVKARWQGHGQGYRFIPSNLNILCERDVHPLAEKCLHLQFLFRHPACPPDLDFNITLRESDPEPFALLPFTFDHE